MDTVWLLVNPTTIDFQPLSHLQQPFLKDCGYTPVCSRSYVNEDVPSIRNCRYDLVKKRADIKIR
jgi:hypothetical protein